MPSKDSRTCSIESLSFSNHCKRQRHTERDRERQRETERQRQAETERDRGRQRQRETEADRETERQRDKETERDDWDNKQVSLSNDCRMAAAINRTYSIQQSSRHKLLIQ